jgi:hypothetical protein
MYSFSSHDGENFRSPLLLFPPHVAGLTIALASPPLSRARLQARRGFGVSFPAKISPSRLRGLSAAAFSVFPPLRHVPAPALSGAAGVEYGSLWKERILAVLPAEP